MFVSETVFKIFEAVCDKPLASFVTSVSAPIFFITNLKISKIYLKTSILSNVSALSVEVFPITGAVPVC